MTDCPHFRESSAPSTKVWHVLANPPPSTPTTSSPPLDLYWRFKQIRKVRVCWGVSQTTTLGQLCVFWVSELPPDHHSHRGFGSSLWRLSLGCLSLARWTHNGKTFSWTTPMAPITTSWTLWSDPVSEDDSLRRFTAYKSELWPFILMPYLCSGSQTRRRTPLWQISVYVIHQNQKLKSTAQGLFLLVISVHIRRSRAAEHSRQYSEIPWLFSLMQ